MAQLVLPLVRRDRPRRVVARGVRDEPARAAPPDAHRDAGNAQGELRGSRTGFLMLIVDDDPLMTDMLPRRLRRVLREDVEIRTAATPAEASELIRALHPDAVLSDYNLRQLQNGLDVLREAEQQAPNAARILFSGHAAGEIAGLGDAPVHAFLEKPMRLDELIGPVLDAIKRATGEDLRGGAMRG